MSKVSVSQSNIHVHAANAAAYAAIAEAEKLHININVSVVDASGVPMAFLRMNGAPLHSISIAEDKAYTAASFGLATDAWLPILNQAEQLKIGLVERPRLVVFGGGLPIVEAGVCIGGIGVSGGSEEQDILCAQAGLHAIGL